MKLFSLIRLIISICLIRLMTLNFLNGKFVFNCKSVSLIGRSSKLSLLIVTSWVVVGLLV
jgi:hypothetical protein